MTGTGHTEVGAAQVSTVATLLRLRRWARPHRRAIAFMLASACGAMIAQSLVPLVIGRVIDGPVRHRDTAGLWGLAGIALLLGITEAGLFFARRRAMAVSALGVETDLRRDLFAHLQRLPVSFHDRWPSGQLLSRLTTDLSTLRRFIGLAAVFLLASTLTIVVVVALLINIQVWLGLVVLASMIPLVVATRRFELRYSRDARRAQDLTGDLATSVEESGARHPGHQVLRPPPAHAGRVQPGRRPPPRRRAHQDQDARGVLGAARGAPATRPGRRHRRRRLRRGRTARSPSASSSRSSPSTCSWCGRSSCSAGCSP